MAREPRLGRCSVAIPTYNEAGTIRELLVKLLNLPIIDRVIIIDDGSTDGTHQAVEELMESHPSITLIERGQKLGLGTAIKLGLEKALEFVSSEHVVTMDADLSHDPGSVSNLVEACVGADIAVGSRYVEGGRVVSWGLRRRLVSKGANALAKLLLRIKTKDCTSGFRCYNRRAAMELAPTLESRGFEVQVEALLNAGRLGLKVVEVPITFTDRALGRSKMGWGEILRFLSFVFRNVGF